MFASTESRLTGQFMAEMRGIEELSGVTVLATTNRPELLDKSLLSSGVFELKIEMPLPDVKAREEIVHILLRRKPLSEDVDIPEIARMTEGMTGGDISQICRRAAMNGLKSDVENFVLRMSDFTEAMNAVKTRRVSND